MAILYSRHGECIGRWYAFHPSLARHSSCTLCLGPCRIVGGSRRWLAIKTIYHRLPKVLRPVWVFAVAAVYEMKFALSRLVRGKNPLPFADWKQKKLDRGMSVWHDWVDWIGGLPFEVAKPEDIIVPLAAQGFRLMNLKTVGNGWGCNEYVFRKD